MVDSSMTINIGGGGNSASTMDSKEIVNAINKLANNQIKTNSLMERLVNNIKQSTGASSSSSKDIQRQIDAAWRSHTNGSSETTKYQRLNSMWKEKEAAERKLDSEIEANAKEHDKLQSALARKRAQEEIATQKRITAERLKNENVITTARKKHNAEVFQHNINYAMGIGQPKSQDYQGLISQITGSDKSPNQSLLSFANISKVAGALSIGKILTDAASTAASLYTNFGQVGTTVGGANPFTNGYQYGGTYANLLNLQQQRINIGRTLSYETRGAAFGSLIGSRAGLVGVGVGSAIGYVGGRVAAGVVNAAASAQTEQQALARSIAIQNNVNAGMYMASHRGGYLPDYDTRTGSYSSGATDIERPAQLAAARGISRYGGVTSRMNLNKYTDFALATGMSPDQIQALAGSLTLSGRMGGSSNLDRAGNIFAAYNLQGMDAVNSANLASVLQSLGMPNAQEQAARLQTSAPNWTSGFQSYNSANPFQRGIQNIIQKSLTTKLFGFGFSDSDINSNTAAGKAGLKIVNSARDRLNRFRDSGDISKLNPTDLALNSLFANNSNILGGNIENANTGLSDLKNVTESSSIMPSQYQQTENAAVNAQNRANAGDGFNMSTASSSLKDLSQTSNIATDSLNRLAQTVEGVIHRLLSLNLNSSSSGISTYSGRTDSVMGSRP
jgi:hypothetical protein